MKYLLADLEKFKFIINHSSPGRHDFYLHINCQKLKSEKCKIDNSRQHLLTSGLFVYVITSMED